MQKFVWITKNSRSVVNAAGVVAIFLLSSSTLFSEFADARDAQKWADVQKLESEYYRLQRDDRYENQHRDEYDQKCAAITNGLRDQVVLESEGKIYRAAAVYLASGTVKDSPYELNEVDDSIHIREGAPVVIVPFPDDQRFTLHVAGDAQLNILRVATGYPGEMHTTGYKSVVPATISQNSIFEIPKSNGDRLLFVLIRCPGDIFVKKYVWVVGH